MRKMAHESGNYKLMDITMYAPPSAGAIGGYDFLATIADLQRRKSMLGTDRWPNIPLGTRLRGRAGWRR